MTTSADAEKQQAPFWTRRGWLMAAGFLSSAMITALVAVATGDGRSGQPAPTAAPGPLTRAAADTPGRPQGCVTDDRDHGTDEAPPEDIRWRTIGGTRVPVSAAAGPTRSAGAVLWCFARTPAGAVMAAHVIPAQMTSPDWRVVTRDQVVAGFTRDLFVSQRASLPDRDIEGRQNGTYTGYRVSDYTSNRATVDLLISSVSGLRFTTSVTLLWSGGDWKVKPGGDGGLHSEMSSTASTTGFVLWKA
ncbi:hypothetical protein [Streptomyces sp. NPDC000618]|uniref:hypothetical protein n=1 Tax=Streptomyces sp. NPDC000618 TaxID=3154265 RepID=UPI003322E4AF